MRWVACALLDSLFARTMASGELLDFACSILKRTGATRRRGPSLAESKDLDVSAALGL